MTLLRYVISTVFVSISFGLTAYILSIAIVDDVTNPMQERGYISLALLPYFIGALINKEGYWHGSANISKRKQSVDKIDNLLIRIMISMFGLLFVGIAAFIYIKYGILALKDYALVFIGIAWGGFVTRAWIIYINSDEYSD